MEREIGNEFRYTQFNPGLPETIVWLKVEEGKNCQGCYFRGWCLSQSRIKELTGLCAATFREDGKSVVFKKTN